MGGLLGVVPPLPNYWGGGGGLAPPEPPLPTPMNVSDMEILWDYIYQL